MPSQRTRTALFTHEKRQDLADAVVAARRFAGWDTTTDLIRAVGRGHRAIYALENAEPTVGEAILSAVGRTLGTRVPGWTADTPREILEGSPPPHLQHGVTPGAPSVARLPEAGGPDEADPAPSPQGATSLSDEDKVRVEVLKRAIGMEELKIDIIYELVAHLLENAGMAVTRENFLSFLTELQRQSKERQLADSNATEQVTPGRQP